MDEKKGLTTHDESQSMITKEYTTRSRPGDGGNMTTNTTTNTTATASTTRGNDHTICSRTTCSWRTRRKTQLHGLRRKKLWCSSCEASHPKSCFTHAERHLPDHLRQCTGSTASIRLCAHRRLTHAEMRRACATDAEKGFSPSPQEGGGGERGRVLCAEGCVGVERYRAERTRGYPYTWGAGGGEGGCCGGGAGGVGGGGGSGKKRGASSTQLFRRHVRLDVDDRRRLGVDDHDLLAAVFAADAQLCPHLRVADCLNDFRFAGSPAAHFHRKGQDACSDECSEFFWCPRSYEGCNTSLYLYSERVHYPRFRGDDDDDDDDDAIDEVPEDAAIVGEQGAERYPTDFDQIHLVSFRNLGAMEDPNDTAWLMQLEDGWRGCARRNKAKFWLRARRKVRRLLRC